MTEDICANSISVQEGNNDTRGRTEGNIVFTTAYFSVGIAINVVCVVAYALLKRNFERTRLRPTLLVVLGALGSLSLLLYSGLLVMMRGEIPCYLTVIFPIILIPFGAGSVVGKLALLLYLSKFTEASMRSKHTELRDSSLSANTSLAPVKVTLWSAYATALRVLYKKSTANESPEQTRNDLYQLHFLISRKGFFAVVMLFLFPFMVFAFVILVTNPVYIYCKNCSVSSTMIGAILFESMASIFLGVCIWWRIRKLRDAWGLANEAFVSIVGAGICLLGFILATFQDRYSYGTYSHQFIMNLGFWVIVVEQSLVQLYLGWRQTRARRLTITQSLLPT
jgi:hypothetical protein